MLRLRKIISANLLALGWSAWVAGAVAQTNAPVADSRPELIYQPRGNFIGQTDRPLRYTPDGTDFVITNGVEFFNRPLYCMNSAFRVDGGDKPEFSLYLPGRGGNLRLGIKTSAGVKWLNDMERIVARYRPGSMVYEIRDPLLGKGGLDLVVLPLSETKGFIVRAEFSEGRVTRVPNDLNRDSRSSSFPVELVWAFGGANGMRGSRGGDIGCEREPVSRFFQLRPEQCRSNEFSIATNTFVLRSRTATIAGVASAGATFFIGDATNWNDASELLANNVAADVRRRMSPATNAVRLLTSAATEFPVVVGQIALPHEEPVYLALQQAGADLKVFSADELPKIFSNAGDHRRAIAERVVVETPDPFINAAAAALNVAADAIWDSQQQSFMHGAVAWRTRLLGWRGPYAGDALGWHERTAAHFAGFAKQQNTDPIPEKISPADENVNLARNETALHSNGDLMNRSHYDMNLVAVDAFFRHLLWTDDLDYARQMWPVIERHLAWERRLFRREFGEDKLPLYEAYAAIWASDDLNYNGGGTAHASAYNYWHNKMAARVAKLIGKDPTSYEREADLILRGMKKYLWLADEGSFAEFKDYLGLQLVHPNAGLWTFYHTLDSEVPTPTEAWQMSRWVDTHIAHIPVQISGNSRREEATTEKSEIDQSLLTSVTETNLYTLPETSWMPYTWSLNNVVVAEAVHMSLGFWQANRRDAAFPLFKGALLDTMFLGLCPGNVGAMTRYDMARGEAQRDFADGIGVTSRALVEGLFGVKPDALAGELKIVPGFPAEWNRASMRHPDFNFSFRRNGLKETFIVEQKFSKPMALRLQIAALRDGVASVTVNGQPAKWRVMEELVGESRVEIQGAAAARCEVVVMWRGGAPASGTAGTDLPKRAVPEAGAPGALDWEKQITAKFEMVSLTPFFNDKVTQIFRNEYRAPRSPFVSLATPKQGVGGWCEPNASFDVDDSGLRAAAAKSGGKIVLPNGVPFATPGEVGAKNIIFTSQWDNYPREVSVPLSGKSSHAFLLMAGSTGAMQSRFDNGEVIVAYTDGTSERLALHNPTTWWPIDQDYFMDDFAFRRNEPIPPRVDLKTGRVRVLDVAVFKGRGGKVPGGAVTVLDLPLKPEKELKSLTVRALANEVVVGLMSVTLER